MHRTYLDENEARNIAGRAIERGIGKGEKHLIAISPGLHNSGKRKNEKLITGGRNV